MKSLLNEGDSPNAGSFKGVALEDLPLETFQEASAVFEEDIRAVLAEDWTIPAEGVMGGSNRAAVERQLGELRGWLTGGKK